jgi:iron complex outermembrane recepter protein
MKSTPVRITVLGALALTGPTAFAQSSNNVATAEAPVVLEEVIVTARKRTENIQDVPISITALTTADLQARGIENLAGVAHFAPNLQVDSTAAVSGSSIASTIFIRGIGQTDFTPNSDPGVGVYLDGVYLARSVGSLLDLVDVQSVEVLRGPQGTLFGKNTIGGALNVTSLPPSPEESGHVEVQGGNFARHDVKLRYDAPLSDTLLTSLSFASLNEDGYQKRILEPGSPDLGNEDRFVVRGRTLWKPTSEFSADVIVDYTRGREQSVPQSVLIIDGLQTGAPFLAAAAGLIPGTTPTLRPGFAGQFTPNDLLDGRFISSNPNSTYYAGPSRSDFDIYGISATLNYDLGPVQLKSISAYRYLTSNFARDSLSSPFLVADTYDDYLDKQWSEELQLLGNLPGGWGNYVLGAYYLGEQGTDSNLVATSIGDLDSGGSVDNHSTAIFGQSNLKLTDRLSATLGLRYTDEKKGFSPGYDGGPQVFISNANGLAAGLPPTLPLIASGNYSTTTSKVDYTAALKWEITTELMGYVSYSTGFKSGGFSQRVGPEPGVPAIPAPSFRPEKAGVAEIGLKWLGLDGRLRINGDVFDTNYRDVQITPLFEGIGPVTRNAGNARVYGGELDMAFLPDRHWEFSGGLGLLHTQYTSLTPESQVDQYLDGAPVLTLHSQLAKSPHVTANLIGTHKWDLPGGHLFSASVDASYTSSMFNDVLNSPELERPALTLLGAALTFDSSSKHWAVTARGENLTNREYIIAGNSERYLGNIGYTQATYARPREYWLSIRRNF